MKTRFGTAGAPAPSPAASERRSRRSEVKTRFGTAGAPAPSPAASRAAGRVVQRRRPGSARRALQRLRRPHQDAGRVVQRWRPGSARRALQRLRRPHSSRLDELDVELDLHDVAEHGAADAGRQARSMPKSLRRSSPVASKPAWRGRPGTSRCRRTRRSSASGRVTSPIVSSPSTSQSSPPPVDPRRAERHRRAALDVEEVGRAHVGVAVGVAGVDRRQVDGRRRRDVSASVGADDDVDVEAAGTGRAPWTRRGGGW